MKQPIKNPFKKNTERYIIAQLNDKVLPVERGALYEDPLDLYLQENKIGQVTGGGTQLTVNKEIKYVEIEVEINHGINITEAAQSIIGKLEQLGAPKGSKLFLTSEHQEIAFGKKEGIAIYLEQLDSSNEDFTQYNIDDIISRLSELIDTCTENQRFMELNNKVILYFYKDTFEEMRGSIAEYIDTYPLKKYIEVTQIA